MQNEKIHLTRIRRLLERLNAMIYTERIPLEARVAAQGEDFKPVQIGEVWGKVWSRAIFQVRGTVPKSLAGKRYGLFFDCDGEACLMRRGSPHQGFTPKVDWYHKAAKFFCPLTDLCAPGKDFELRIEASANDLFGAGKQEYALRHCELAVRDEELYQSAMDIGVLLDLAESLPAGTVRRQRLIYGLDQACNLWESDPDAARAILRDLLSRPAQSSALTAFSVGHAHLDLAWLWPIHETKRKGGRTFANALRLLEQYPNYVFGASQAQLYAWIKEQYPALYAQVKDRVKQGRWEVQGASWVEFDTNLISSESIIRQFLYGKRFFQNEFGFAPRVLWLPDCFGFSGNLPQFLKGCVVDWFVTQKLSWNESNVFPHHLFVWEGIDGTRVLAHQLPTNDYNFSNNPSAFLETEKRYAQSELCDAFLNLYGIGDGGGGPTRDHIEYGLRQQNLEGVGRFRFARSTDFFEHLKDMDPKALPVAYGELYLEFHRGTYTTQARMKELNRDSERRLGEAEYLAVLCGVRTCQDVLRDIWQDTLLLQFHDIIPGSSITQVYQDASITSRLNHDLLDGLTREMVKTLTEKSVPGNARRSLVFNTCNQDLDEWREFPKVYRQFQPHDEAGKPLPCLKEGKDSLLVRLQIPAWNCRQINFIKVPGRADPAAKPASAVLQNRWLKVRLTPMGGISSILDKATGRELLAAESNLLQLWEDEPNNWGAWDINHFYRGTRPQGVRSAQIITEQSISLRGQFDRMVMDLVIGNSQLRQTVELRTDEPFIRVSHSIQWQERHRMLRAHFYPQIHSGTATYGIQSGVIQRSAKPKNAWEEAQFEVPAQRFADLSQPDRGCALICDVKFGWRIRDNEMELNLLRSPADVDPEADIGTHGYAYAFYPHAGDYAHSDVFNVAERLAHRLIVIPSKETLRSRPEPPFRLTSDNVNLDTVKHAEDGSGIVLRLHEYRGMSGTAELELRRPFHKAFACNMLEEAESEIILTSTLCLEFRPFEIKTLMLLEER